MGGMKCEICPDCGNDTYSWKNLQGGCYYICSSCDWFVTVDRYPEIIREISQMALEKVLEEV